MKKIWLRLILVSVLLLLSGNCLVIRKTFAQTPPMNADTRVSYFYDSLLPYGNWIWHARYGWCWYPNNVTVDWRPYSDGYWTYTDYGWTWVSDDPWGWACFHYGRWFYDDSYGWLWWPDTVWAPSWVIWRTGGDWIGWAPCPPEALWNDEMGLNFGFGVFDYFFPSRWFCFVHRSHFIDRDLRHRIEMRARNVTIFNETKVTSDNLKFEHDHIFNRLPVQQELEKDLGHPVTRLKLADAESPERSRVEGNEVRLFRPGVRGKAAEAVRQLPEAEISSPEIKNRHAAEMRALEESQINRQNILEQQHTQEIKSARDANMRQQLTQRHQMEIQAQKELMGQERQLIQQWHSRENRIVTAPFAPPQQHFNFHPQTEFGGGTEERNDDGRGGGRRR